MATKLNPSAPEVTAAFKNFLNPCAGPFHRNASSGGTEVGSILSEAELRLLGEMVDRASSRLQMATGRSLPTHLYPWYNRIKESGTKSGDE